MKQRALQHQPKKWGLAPAESWKHQPVWICKRLTGLPCVELETLIELEHSIRHSSWTLPWKVLVLMVATLSWISWDKPVITPLMLFAVVFHLFIYFIYYYFFLQKGGCHIMHCHSLLHHALLQLVPACLGGRNKNVASIFDFFMFSCSYNTSGAARKLGMINSNMKTE